MVVKQWIYGSNRYGNMFPFLGLEHNQKIRTDLIQ